MHTCRTLYNMLIIVYFNVETVESVTEVEVHAEVEATSETVSNLQLTSCGGK